MHTQVTDVRVHEHTGRLRQEHLPAVADGGDACALVHVEADLALVRQPRLARVQPHPHTYRPVGKCALAVRRGGDGVRRAGEGDEERVTLHVDFDALVVDEHRAESPPMLVQRLPWRSAARTSETWIAATGGEAASVALCHELGLDYVSCSPYRVPLARLAAAQAALKECRVHCRGG